MGADEPGAAGNDDAHVACFAFFEVAALGLPTVLADSD